MFKTIQIIVMATLCLNFNSKVQSQSPLQSKQAILGRVISSTTGEALPGTVIKVTEPNHSTVSNDKGEFILTLSNGTYNLSISHLGYETKSISIQIPLKEPLVIALDTDDKNLQVVEIVSTGYQNIPKERATGSFTRIDNKLFNRTVSTDLLSRLTGVTNGLLLDRSNNTATNSLGISIRGRSTIFSNTTPLIVLDNFPFTGDINTINPETIESITILKDAAAASIWGAFSGNGVIVITTKKGVFNQTAAISFKADLTVGEKPDLYYEPQLTSSEFIDIEKFLFEQGAYTATINDGYSTISPVVVLLQKIKLNPDYTVQGNTEINALRNIDYRKQLNQYFYRKSTQQRYFMDVRGGSSNQTYFFSAGYDKGLPNSVALSDSRLTLKANNTYNMLNNRLQLNTDINFSKSQSNNKNSGSNYLGYVPYELIADETGNALPTLRASGLRESYTNNPGEGKLLDWKYRPLDELRQGYSSNRTDLTDYRINIGLNYKIISPLSFSLNYQYYNATTKGENLNTRESFYTRDLINTYSQINTTTGAVIRPIPLGNIYSPIFKSRQSNYARAQLNFNRFFGVKHAVAAIAGYEIRDDNGKSYSYTLYGYNPETASNITIDQVSQFPNYYTGLTSTIGARPAQDGLTNRYTSWYGNASYTYDDRYIISGSYRKDASNLFGVKANQKGVPLWSTGIAWNMHKENFFTIDWLTSLQLKANYGYNGNVNSSISAYLTAGGVATNQLTKTQYLKVINPPNEALRWERVKNINGGIYFSTKENLISGSIELYSKKGMDLIGNSPIAPQTGVSIFTGNTADIHSKGIDVQLNSRNIDQIFKWSTNFIFTFIKDKIVSYKVKPGSNSDIVSASSSSLAPLIGYPINSIFGYKWAGLDASGNPQGYLDGVISTDYSKINNSTDLNQLQFFGSQTPIVYGGLRNSFSYKNLELSFNITYKMGSYFRRKSLNNATLFSPGGFKITDYNLRWQKPGDELITNVPAPVYPNNTSRNSFYQNAAVLIERGDLIRLQDIQINYSFTRKQFKKLPFNNVNIYAYTTNLGLLWTANKKGLDPDVSSYPIPKTIAFGVNINF
ncbi:SusC/RagA family TonB-linked outer membrane protein [Pedobacter sp. ASV1-7]|uniref:SusC/RagA family TonB-linked outer membrane protein n=1 Tax=Pedobacter sp. ASV1-7 TaxID=3145237 RepID=UPI0032E91952